MQSKKLPYLLGLIKWINTFTFLMWTSSILARTNVFAGEASRYISLIIAFILTQVVFTFGFGKFLEKKFGKDQLIDNHKIFKILSLTVMIGIASYLVFIRKEVKIFLFILAFGLIFSLLTGYFLKVKSRARQQSTKEGF